MQNAMGSFTNAFVHVWTAAVGLASAARIGNTWGTNIHWTSALPGEAAMMATAYRVARMDLTWQSVEKTCGKYDFSAYDGLVAELSAVGVTPYLILDYRCVAVCGWHGPRRAVKFCAVFPSCSPPLKQVLRRPCSFCAVMLMCAVAAAVTRATHQQGTHAGLRRASPPTARLPLRPPSTLRAIPA